MLFFIFCMSIGLTTFNALLNFERIKQDKLTEFQLSARWIESEQHRHIAQARMVSFMTRNLIRKGLTEKICDQGFVDSPGLDPEFGNVAIAEPDGNIVCNSIPWLRAKNVAEMGYFKNAMKTVDWGVIDRADNHNETQYSAIMARAMRDDGHVEKVILVAMDFSWVKEEIDMISLPSEGHLLLVDDKGVVIAGSHNIAEFVDKSINNTSFYKQAITTKVAAFDGAGFTGADSLVVVRQFKTGSGLMHIIIDVPRNVLLQSAYRNLTITILLSVMMLALLLMLAYSWGNKYFLRKINLIAQASDLLATGDMTSRVQLDGGDELSRLANSFDAMADSIQAKNAEIKLANDELYRVNRALRVLSAGNRSLLFATSEVELLARICHEIVEKGDYLAAWIGFSGTEHDQYLRRAASYLKKGDESAVADWDELGNGIEPVLASVRDDTVLVVNDTNHESVHQHLNAHAEKVGYRSVIVLPLHLAGKPFGAMVLGASDKDEFSGVQVEYLRETASDTSFGIEMLRTKGENVRLETLGQHYEASMNSALEDALYAIALTIEMRDPYTAGHQRRVAELARAIAIELGLNEIEIHGIFLAAIVHDIGKINVPAEILVKPGILNEMEFALIKHHVVAGYEILKNVKFPWPIAQMVHQHHERLDGSGYPLGLKDGEILFGARIMAVADVVEAMSSHRPYRAGLGLDVALQELKNGRSTLYDAAVVDACVKIFQEGRFTFTP